MVQLPSSKVRPLHVPTFTSPVGCQNESPLFGADQQSYPAHVSLLSHYGLLSALSRQPLRQLVVCLITVSWCRRFPCPSFLFRPCERRTSRRSGYCRRLVSRSRDGSYVLHPVRHARP